MNSLFITLMIGGWQIGIAVFAILILFGGKKIPEMMKGLGTGIKEFKDATKEEEEEKKNIEDNK